MMQIELSESEVNLVVQGLELLLTQKRAAFTQAGQESINFEFEPRHFGIPQIMSLLKKIEGEAHE